MTDGTEPAKKGSALKAYFVEGLLIFIAVSLGSLAEGFRDDLSDKQKEEAYIHSMISDLQQDSILFQEAIRDNLWKLKWIDSLMSVSNKSIADRQTRKSLYRYASNAISYYSVFQSKDATMLQLKNAGGLQLIRHSHVADSIAMYDQIVRSIYAAEVPYSNMINVTTLAMGEIFVLRAIQNDSAYSTKNSPADKDLPILTTDPLELEKFFNLVYLQQGWTENYVKQLKRHSPYVSKLIRLLKQEYPFD